MRKPAKTSTSFLKVAECLYRNESSDGYYALVKKSGKQIRRSLKTKDRKLADRRLREFREQLTGLDLSKGQITKKDGGILALVKHELALQPGVAVLERFLDPTGNPEIEIKGDEVSKFPELKPFEAVSVKASRIKEVNGQLTISSWEQVQ